jgi:hypothetical protein
MTILLVYNSLGAHVYYGPYEGVSDALCLIEVFAYTKICNFNFTFSIQQYILRFDVPMNEIFSEMDVHKSVGNLPQ